MPKWIKLKYRHKIAAAIFLFTLIPMVVLGLFLFGKVWDGKVEEILSRNRVQLANSVNDINNLFTSTEDKIKYITNNYYLYSFLETNTDQNLIGIMSFFDYLQSVMGAIKADNNRSDMVIYSFNNTTYDSEYIRTMELFNSELAKNEKDLPDEIIESNSNKIIWKYRIIKRGYFNTRKDTNYICAYKKITSIYKPLAIIEARLPFSEITGFFQYDMPEGSYIVYNMENSGEWINIKDGEADAGLPENFSGSDFLHSMQNDFYLLDMDLNSGVGKVCMFIPRSYILQEMRWYVLTATVLFLIVVLIMFFTIEVASYYLTKKLSLLFARLNTNIESLIIDDNISVYTSEDEFGKIGNMFHELITRIKEFYKKIGEYELDRKALETQLLQERINPHFLYNTLSTMKWVINDHKVHKVIDSLVKYYRIALNKGSGIIKISDELEMIEEYLKLQKFAYGNDFDYAIDIEKGIGDYSVLKNLLQPVVENAVLHGVNGLESGGMIIITCKKLNENIVFEVSDNGIGMDMAALEKVTSGNERDAYGGYGMINVRRRIAVFYGEQSGLDIKSEKNRGTSVTITIPCLINPEVHNRFDRRNEK